MKVFFSSHISPYIKSSGGLPPFLVEGVTDKSLLLPLSKLMRGNRDKPTWLVVIATTKQVGLMRLEITQNLVKIAEELAEILGIELDEVK